MRSSAADPGGSDAADERRATGSRLLPRLAARPCEGVKNEDGTQRASGSLFRGGGLPVPAPRECGGKPLRGRGDPRRQRAGWPACATIHPDSGVSVRSVPRAVPGLNGVPVSPCAEATVMIRPRLPARGRRTGRHPGSGRASDDLPRVARPLDDDQGALSDQGVGSGEPDAARGSGHDGDAAVARARRSGPVEPGQSGP